MGSAGAVTAREAELVDRLVSAGIESTQALVTIMMYTRGHARPEIETIDIVRQYSGLSAPGIAESALANARRQNWLEEVSTGSVVLLSSPQDLPAMLASFLADPGFEHALKAQREQNQPTVTVLGGMHSPEVYESFGPIIQSASDEILLPMINTTPRLAQVKDLQAAARSGVEIRVLLATPRLAAKIRGNAIKAESADRIRAWQQNAKGIDTFRIRVTNRESDLRFASSACVDGRTVRIDIFNPSSQRSTQGVMVEARSDTNSNLALVFQQIFNDAWRRAHAAGPLGYPMSLLKKSWLPLLTILAFAAALVFSDRSSVIVAFTGGVVAGLVSNYLPRVPNIVSEMLDRLRR